MKYPSMELISSCRKHLVFSPFIQWIWHLKQLFLVIALQHSVSELIKFYSIKWSLFNVTLSVERPLNWLKVVVFDFLSCVVKNQGNLIQDCKVYALVHAETHILEFVILVCFCWYSLMAYCCIYCWETGRWWDTVIHSTFNYSLGD